MVVRVAVLSALLCFLSTVVEAQAPGVAAQPRVRITVSQMVRAISPQTGQQLMVLEPGKRVVGRAMEVRNRVVTFVKDGQQETIAIPLDSIGVLEVSDPRRHRHVLRGVLLGVGAFYGTAALIFFAGCGLDCSDAIFIPTIGTGIVTGLITGRSREAWRTEPASWLLSHVGVDDHIDSHE